MKHKVQNLVDPVLPEQPRLPAIDLHQITAGLGAVFVIAIKRGERRQMIGPDVGEDRIASDVVIGPSVRAARRGRQSGSGYSRNGSCWRSPCWRRSTSPGSGSQEDFARFDDLFAAYWLNRERERADKSAGGPESKRAASARSAQDCEAGGGRADQPDTGQTGEVKQGGKGRLTGSRIRNLMRVVLREGVSSAGMANAETIAERLARTIRDRRSRRDKSTATSRRRNGTDTTWRASIIR